MQGASVVEKLRAQSKKGLQRIAGKIAGVLGMRVEGTFTKGEYIEFTGRISEGAGDIPFVFVLHTGTQLSKEFVDAFNSALKKENARAVIFTLGKPVEWAEKYENIEIYAGEKIDRFFETHEELQMEAGEQYAGLEMQVPTAKVVPQKPGSGLPSIDVLEKHMKSGMKLFERKEYEKAIQIFDEALQLKPNYDRAIIMKARAYAAMGDMDTAIEIFRKATATQPDSYELWYEFADLLHALEKYDDELECYARALEINKRFDKAWNNMGIVYFLKEKYDDARYCFERAIKIKPDNPEYINNLATVLKKQGNLEEAIKHYQRALEILPDYMEVLLNMGMTYMEMKRHEDAYLAFAKYLEKNEVDAPVWHLAGVSAMNAGDYNRAIECFERALKIRPDFREAKEGLREAKRKLTQKGDKHRIQMKKEDTIIGGGKIEGVVEEAERKANIVDIEVKEETEHIEKPVVKNEVTEASAGPADTAAPKGLAALVSALARNVETREETGSGKLSADEHIKIRTLIDEGNLNEAYKMLENKSELNENPAFSLTAGIVYAGMGKYTEALAFFDAVLSKQKNSIEAMMGKELCAFYLKNYSMSVELLETIAQKYPDNLSLKLKKCLALYSLQDYSACLKELKESGKHLMYSDLYWYMMGNVEAKLGNMESASKCFENARKINARLKMPALDAKQGT